MAVSVKVCYSRLKAHNRLSAPAAISVRYGVDGATLARIEVAEKVLGANIVEQRLERVLVIVTAPSIFVYSLPGLDLLDRKQR